VKLRPKPSWKNIFYRRWLNSEIHQDAAADYSFDDRYFHCSPKVEGEVGMPYSSSFINIANGLGVALILDV